MAKTPAIPREFEDLLSRRGRRVLMGADQKLAGALSDPRRRFVALNGMVEETRANALRLALDRAFYDALSPLAAPIPPQIIEEMRANNDDWLPKTVRVKTAYLENRRSRAYRLAQEIGLLRLLRSASFRGFAEAILGKPLDPQGGEQVICYGAGDYSGPHTDHHPRLKRAAKGYLDMHLSLANASVAHQYLIYARGGHWCEMAPVHRNGCITIYRLPFWHMTTPLWPKRAKREEARRWLLLGTYFYRD